MRILDRLPIHESGWIVPAPDGVEEVKPYQIIVMISISNEGAVTLPEDAHRFPAILDTGNNHNLAIRRGHLDRWAPLVLPQRAKIEVGGFAIPLLAADVWIHPNQPGTVDPSGLPAFRLELKGGIAVYPPDVPNPARLPTLGLRPLIHNKLRLTVDGEGRNLSLESPSA